MEPEAIEKLAAESIADTVTLSRRGLNDYRVNLPFTFGDGDNLKVILKQSEDDKFILTDEAHTFMYLSYNDTNISNSDVRQKRLDQILLSHNMVEEDGRLIMKDINSQDIGAAIFTFSQALLKVGDFSMWKREYIKSLFIEDFQQCLPECVGDRKCIFDYKYHDIDPAGTYSIDCLICGKRNNVHVYAVNSDAKAKDSALSIRFYNEAKMMYPSCVIFDATVDIGRKSRIQVTDAAEKAISALEMAPELLPVFLEKMDRAA